MAEVRKNTVHPLHIEGYTAEGMGVARLDGRVVFIPGTIRGEAGRYQLLKVNKGRGLGQRDAPDLPLPRPAGAGLPLQRAVRGVPVPPHVL